jgi:hypothetical protein
MITRAEWATHPAPTLEPRESAMTSKVAPTAGRPACLPPATQPTAPTQRPAYSLPHGANSARARVKASV